MQNSEQNRPLAVQVAQLSHHYGKIQALNEVSLQLPQGVSVGVIGADGVGKSTLLSLIAGVRVIQSGEIHLFGQNLAQAATREAMSLRVAFMPQGLGKNLYPTLSINENIEFHANLYGLSRRERKNRIARLLAATGLQPFADRPAGKLSGGMKQKLSLCCALVHSPDLLILDEPTTGVDPLSRGQFWQLIADLRRESPQMTVIVATAYIDEAEGFDQVIAMDEGNIIAHQPTAQLIAASQSENLEQAYNKLLPLEKRGAENGIAIPPFQPEPNAPPAIQAVGLTKKFANFTSVDHVSFTIPRGEIFGFLGSNGCGKSTTMKMLTGLLPASEGTAELLGEPIDANNLDTRKKVGYMSQAFSLYEELTVRQNLALHAKLYQMDSRTSAAAIEQIMQQFHLSDVAEATPAALPLGIRQRLQLAAACLHQPEVLILDEPTSGVDPASRDLFWQYLIKLSREQKITIFVTTHFMNEAALCDRISFMHRGKVLDIGTPEELVARQQVANLEQAFIRYLEQQDDEITAPKKSPENPPHLAAESELQAVVFFQNFTILRPLALVWAFALREGKELLRDKIRLLFALGGPTLMLLAMASSISFDITPSQFAVWDRDQSSESQKLLEQFRGSAYFIEREPLHSPEQVRKALQSGEVKLVIDIPEQFGQKMLQGQQPEIGLLIDGAFPSVAENLKNSAAAVIGQYQQQLAQEQGSAAAAISLLEPRFVYNPDFKSVFAITPGVIMLAMMMIPAIMTAVGVVREKEVGSIMNLYGSPASAWQFLLGKQLPYVALAFGSYLLLITLAVGLFGVPIKGSLWAMLLGGLLAILASTAFGLVVSSFVKSQVAALFATAILIMIPTMNFSGMMYPTATLPASTKTFAHLFPGAWFQPISLGGFTKGLSFNDFLANYAGLLAIYCGYLWLSCRFLKKQER